jgi:hypothetical protein
MGWERRLNSTLKRTIGYQLSRPPGHTSRHVPPPTGNRMLTAPVFILSPARAGSTLLRMILGSHSALYAPPELPLGHLRVKAETKWIKTSMDELELTQRELEYMLWDRVLAHLLSRSGKSTMVAKTPANVLVWEQIAECWPDARYIFLLRHPANAIASLNKSWSGGWHPKESGTLEESASKALRYMTSLEEARHALNGRTVRYEDLTAEPTVITRQLCEYLGIPFEPAMIEYGEFSHGRIGAGLGDASVKLKSGRIQPAAPPPDLGELPEGYRRMCATWGYMLPKQDAKEPALASAKELPDLSSEPSAGSVPAGEGS